MNRFLFACLLLCAIGCSSDDPYHGLKGQIYIVATDTVQHHYPIKVSVNGVYYGSIYTKSETSPANCGEAEAAYNYTTEMDERVVRMYLPVGATRIDILPAKYKFNDDGARHIDMDVNEYCNYGHIPTY